MTDLTALDNEKILAIKKVLYDRNGAVTDKGRIILKELGIKPEDLEEKPRDFFKKKNEGDSIVDVRFEFHKSLRLNRLMKVQNSLHTFASTTNGKSVSDRASGVVADGGKMSRSLANLFNKKVRPLYAGGASTTIQSPSNEQSISNGGGTFFTDLKSDMHLLQSTNPTGQSTSKTRPGTVAQTKGGRSSVSLSRTQTDPFLLDKDFNSFGLTGTGSMRRNLSRPMSISLRVQDDRDLRQMRVFENSITRSEEKNLQYRSKVTLYEQKVAKAAKKAKEAREDRSESLQKVHDKRDHVKQNKLRHVEELDQQAYQGYIDYIEKRRESTPMHFKDGRNSRQLRSADSSRIKLSQSQTHLKSPLLMSPSGSSFRGTAGALMQKDPTTKEIDMQLDTIKERLRRGNLRRKVIQQEAVDKNKQYSTKLERSKEQQYATIYSHNFQNFANLIKKNQKQTQALNKSNTKFNELWDRRKVKTSERHQRNVSQRQINLSDRDERLQKIVTDYHMKIDDQVQQRQSQGRLSTTLKKTMRNEWVSVTSDNQQYYRDAQQRQNEQTFMRQRIVDRSVQRLHQLREYKQDLSLQSNFARQMHKKSILDQLQYSKQMRVYPLMTTPLVLKQRQNSFLANLSGTQTFQIPKLLSPSANQKKNDDQDVTTSMGGGKRR